MSQPESSEAGDGNLKSPRLILRPWSMADLHALPAIFGDPAVMAYSDNGVSREEQQAAWLQDASSKGNRRRLPLTLAITTKGDAQIIGYTSLSQDPRRISANDVEIGFRLIRSAWGFGYASEAAMLMIARALDLPSVARVVAVVDPQNERSIQLVARLGMTYRHDIMFDGYDYPDHLYAIETPQHLPIDPATGAR